MTRTKTAQPTATIPAVRIPYPLRKELENRARKEGRTMTDCIIQAISEWIDRR